MFRRIKEAIATVKHTDIIVDAELPGGQYAPITLSRAVELDDPEGTVAVRMSASMVGRIVDRIGGAEYLWMWWGAK